MAMITAFQLIFDQNERAIDVKLRPIPTPISRPIPTPPRAGFGLIHVGHMRAPRPGAARFDARAATAVGGACAPTWIKLGMNSGRRFCQLRFLKRQLVLPVSIISQ
jgi:hypothetical protein